jgi:hypothetical protein
LNILLDKSTNGYDLSTLEFIVSLWLNHLKSIMFTKIHMR